MHFDIYEEQIRGKGVDCSLQLIALDGSRALPAHAPRPMDGMPNRLAERPAKFLRIGELDEGEPACFHLGSDICVTYVRNLVAGGS